MNLKKLLILIIGACAVLDIIALIIVLRLLIIASEQVDVKQDEKDWSIALQKERDRRGLESGREAFDRLDQKYGDSSVLGKGAD